MTAPFFGWIDAYFPGIPFHNLSFENGKKLQGLAFDRTLGAITHAGERIVVKRDVDGNNNGVNLAYAWEEGLEMSELKRIVWQNNRWELFTDSSYIWDPLTRSFIHI